MENNSKKYFEKAINCVLIINKKLTHKEGADPSNKSR